MRAFEYMVFNGNIYVQEKLRLSIQRISNMYVYSDIVKLSLVGNSQVPIMGFLPINSNFQKRSLGIQSIFECQSQGKQYKNNIYKNFN